MGNIGFQLILLLIFVVPIGLLIFFVQMRAKKRREMLAGPWSALAGQYGGQFDGTRVFCQRGAHTLELDMVLVSVMQAAGVPYYDDGGTYTLARVRTPHAISTQASAVVSGAQVEGMVPGARVPAGTRLVLEAQSAVLVFDGPAADPAALHAAFATLDAIANHTATAGPLPVG